MASASAFQMQMQGKATAVPLAFIKRLGPVSSLDNAAAGLAGWTPVLATLILLGTENVL
jgi:hypothetical protein